MVGLSAAIAACVPPGNSTPSDSGIPAVTTAVARPNSPAPMTTPFEDNFNRPNTGTAEFADAAEPTKPTEALDLLADARLAHDANTDAPPLAQLVRPTPARNANPIGPDWHEVSTNAWRIENGRLCVENAKNHGLWLKRILPVNARIEFDAIAETADGDLKAESWGDGQSAATSISYTNATSYLTILGGWKNTLDVLARINEHGSDRKEIKIDKESDDPRQHPVDVGQVYHFKIERNDGKTVHWSVDGVEYLSYVDSEPLVGAGHDHFGFNNWEAKVCFDNVHITPL
jgi:hypothetical protein